jgi:integrase/recombinase XerD
LGDCRLDDFWLEYACTLRTASLRNLRGCLSHHLRWLAMQGMCWRRADHNDLHRYLRALVDRQLADATLGLYRWALAHLYHWAHRAGHRNDNPAAALSPMRRRPRTLRWVPTREQVQHMLQAPNVRTNRGVRDRCILELLYATGMRAAELLSLQTWQIACASRCITITGKGDRERLVIFGQEATYWLERYLRQARPGLIAQGTGYAASSRGTSSLFVHPTPGLRLNYMALWRMVRRHGQRAGYPLFTPHVFRHAFATHCHDAGMDLAALQILLGHANINTTTIYLRTSLEKLRALLERHHPRGLHYQPFERVQRGNGSR